MRNKMNITGICTYETPCGWCTKWDKKCDNKIGYEKHQRGLRANTTILDDAMDSDLRDIVAGKGLKNADTHNTDGSGIYKEN
jgi:hypothetical protein